MADETGIARQGGTTIAPKPDYLSTPELGPRGFQEMETKDLTLPRLSLCQAMSPQRQKSKPDVYIPNLKEGEFFNSLTQMVYGPVVHIIPLFFYKSRIWFKDINAGGGILCQAPDGKACQLNNGGPCLHANWGPGGEPPECTEFFNYPSLLLRNEGDEQVRELIVLSLKATGMKAAKAWNSMMRLRQADMFSGIYEVSSFEKANAAGQVYQAWSIKNSRLNNGWATKEQYEYADNQYTGVYEGIRTGTIVTHMEGMDSELHAQEQAETVGEM